MLDTALYQAPTHTHRGIREGVHTCPYAEQIPLDRNNLQGRNRELSCTDYLLMIGKLTFFANSYTAEIIVLVSTGGHGVPKHFSLVANLFLLPLQPPYMNCSHCCELEL